MAGSMMRRFFLIVAVAVAMCPAVAGCATDWGPVVSAESRGRDYPEVTIPANGSAVLAKNSLLTGDETVWILPPGQVRAVALILRGILTGHAGQAGDLERLVRIDPDRLGRRLP
jgi:hypothetical protein